jgi:hypothetical protein
MSLLDNIWNAVTGFLSEIESSVSDVLNIKEIATEELSSLLKDLNNATKGLKDFEHRVKTLRGRVIRADIAFKLIDEIRTGELRDFVTNTLGDLRQTILSSLEEGIAAGQQLRVVKSGGPVNLVKSIIDLIQKVYKGYAIVTAILHALHQLVPIVHSITQKLEEFEGIVMPQNSDRSKVTESYYKRKRLT